MDMYLPSDTKGHTRRTNRWSCMQRVIPRVDKGTVCSVSDNGGGDVSIICRAKELWTAPPTLDFWGVLHEWQRTWMWDNLQWVGNDEWLARANTEGTCITVTDGSYMRDLYATFNWAAVVIECPKGKGWLWCSFPEASRAACSYRGELLGLMAIHLILLAINEVNPGLTGLIHIYSDCLGVLHKVQNLLPSRVPSRLAHSDVLKNILVNCNNLTFERYYLHVLAHQDNNVDYGDLSRPAQLNVNMDYNAKQALWSIQLL
jgi:hypothetical protein